MEYKFRAWDTQWTPACINEGVAIPMMEYFGLGCSTFTLNCDIQIDGRDPNVTIMQYTGLKDSQVVEEYYGDILIATFDGGDEWEIFVIEDGPAAVIFRNFATDEVWYFWQMPVHYVIGNIYENKELLDDNK